MKSAFAIPSKVAVALAIVFFAACSGSDPTLGTVSVQVSGLVGSGLVLQNNGSDDLAIGANGLFEFATPLAAGTRYAVTVSHQPSDMTLNCVAINAGRSGVTSDSAATRVAVRCAKVASIAYVRQTDAVTQVQTSVAVSIDPSTGALVVLPSSRSEIDVASPFIFVPGGAFGYGRGGAGITGYALDRVTGVFSSLVGSPFGAGAVPRYPQCDLPGFCRDATPLVQFLAMQPDGRRLYAYYEQIGPGFPSIPVVSAIVAFDIDPATGALSASAAPSVDGGYGPIGLGIEAAGRFLYLADQGNFHVRTLAAVARYAIDPSTGALDQTGADPIATWPASFEPLGRFAYTADSPSGTLQSFAVDATTGALTATGAPAALPGFNSLALDAAGAFVYAGCTGGLCAFSLDPTSGLPAAVAGSPFDTAAEPSQVTADRGGRFLLAVCGPAVCVWRPDPQTGIPTQVPGSPFLVPGLLAPTTIVVVN